MAKMLRMIGQGLAYLAFGAALAYASNRPLYTHFPEDKALIKVSLSHSGKPKGGCRQRSAAELEALAQNMRRATVCSRERVPIRIEIRLDGKPLLAETLEPGGLRHDGPARLYKRFRVAPGRHRIEARLRDSLRKEGFDYVKTAEVALAPAQNFVIDFRSETGGFLFQ